jgi:hypothetical protein
MRTMSIVLQAIPLAFLAIIVTLIARPLLARRRPGPMRPPRTPPKPKRSHLSVVSRSRMDDELNDLLKRR